MSKTRAGMHGAHGPPGGGTDSGTGKGLPHPATPADAGEATLRDSPAAAGQCPDIGCRLRPLLPLPFPASLFFLHVLLRFGLAWFLKIADDAFQRADREYRTFLASGNNGDGTQGHLAAPFSCLHRRHMRGYLLSPLYLQCFTIANAFFKGPSMKDLLGVNLFLIPVKNLENI